MKYRASDYMPLPAVAETLGCSRQTVYRLIESGELEGMQLNDHGWWRVLERSLDKYLAKRMGKRARKNSDAKARTGNRK